MEACNAMHPLLLDFSQLGYFSEKTPFIKESESTYLGGYGLIPIITFYVKLKVDQACI